MTRILLLACAFGVLMPATSALAQQGGGYDLSWNALDGGGGNSGDGAFNLKGSIGQACAGEMTGSVFRLTGGFMAGIESAPACAADFNRDGTANSQDFFDYLTAFFDQAPSADFNHDGTVNSQDFFDFLGVFFAGC